MVGLTRRPDLTREYEIVEGLRCEIEFTFDDGSLATAYVTHIQLRDGSWVALSTPYPSVWSEDLREFAEAEKAESDADSRAESKLDAMESARGIDW